MSLLSLVYYCVFQSSLIISQLRCRYEELLADKFDRVYFERPGKYHHPIGENDYISVYQRK